MEKTIRLRETGGPEVFDIDTHEISAPSAGEVLIRQQAVGLNYVDIYFRSGLYPLANLPATLGVEAAGIVEAIGETVIGLKPGDRVAYAFGPGGAYTTARTISAERTLLLPPDLSTNDAAASLFKGLTTYMLLKEVYPVGEGTTIFVPAAAGGLGSTLVRWAKHFGAKVIGAVSSPEKAKRVKTLGADHVLVGRGIAWSREIRDLTDGRGVDVAYEGLGGENTLRTLDCIRPFGMAVNIGQITGSLPQTLIREIGAPRAVAFCRPSVIHYISDLKRYRRAADIVLELMAAGLVTAPQQTFAFDEVANAHAAMERGETTGCSILTV
ncbi:NADPH2:quinone reductase [Peteryoungia aggregata LMG 23059]|uniref:NADPH2:quinone reductase n=1 Tax=Peteryoungia aggregata LMG 23059 TaxID=1368425 RepID=A0ABU0G989_9HYPH|nr:quinone oxidoreductase [Peteryoungia aggregata]MDQ0421916.1 NADPH2:quinone reductase [Peteryoungia aggregata LMG 23059]